MRPRCGSTGGLRLTVKQREVIGSAISRTGVHDLPATEAVFRFSMRARWRSTLASYRIHDKCDGRPGGCGRVVHAFEPHPAVVEPLERNVTACARKSCMARTQIHPVAVSDFRGHATEHLGDVR